MREVLLTFLGVYRRAVDISYVVTPMRQVKNGHIKNRRCLPLRAWRYAVSGGNDAVVPANPSILSRLLPWRD